MDLTTAAKADIFFVVTTGAVVVVAVAIAVSAYFAVRVIQEARALIVLVRTKAEELGDDLDEARRTAMFPVRFLQKLFTRIGRQ